MVRRNESTVRRFCEFSGHRHLHPSASTSFPPLSPTVWASASFTGVGHMAEAPEAPHTLVLWTTTPGSNRRRLTSGWFIASEDFSPHLPSSAARLNYIIYKTVEDLWTPLMLGAVWLVGTASIPVGTYTHHRLSMQKIEETQRGGQRRFCAMKMAHWGGK